MIAGLRNHRRERLARRVREYLATYRGSGRSSLVDEWVAISRAHAYATALDGVINGIENHAGRMNELREDYLVAVSDMEGFSSRSLGAYRRAAVECVEALEAYINGDEAPESIDAVCVTYLEQYERQLRRFYANER